MTRPTLPLSALPLVVLALGAAPAPRLVAAGAGQLPPTPGRPQVHLRSHADLVVLHVAVLDRRGHFVSGLDASSFLIYEDNRPQQVRFFDRGSGPVTAGLVIDNSGSMRGHRDTVVAAGLAFARASNPDDDIFIVLFNERAVLGLPDTLPFTSHQGLLRASLGRLAAQGRTAMFDALDLALTHVDKGRHDRKLLILLGDGGDNASTTTFDHILTRARAASTVIHTVALVDPHDTDADPRLLERLAEETGGAAHRPAAIGEVVGFFERIGHEVQNAYTIGYVPTNAARDGTYRRVRVSVSAPGRRVHARTRVGYLAPGGSR